MAIRTEAELEAQIANTRSLISNLIVDNDTGEIGAGDMRTVLTTALETIMDLVDSVAYTAMQMAGGVSEARVGEIISTFMAAAITGNTETRVTVTYNPSTMKLNFVVPDMSGGGGGLTLAEVIAAVQVGTTEVSGVILSRTETATEVTLDLAVPSALTHLRYFGWSDDNAITQAEMLAGNTSQTDEGTLPARVSNGYPFFAVPQDVGFPTELYIGANSRNAIAPTVVQQAGTIDDGGGEPHLIGVWRRLQVPALGGTTIRLGYN